MELYNDPVITKYSTDFVISFDELSDQYSQIKPKNIPIYDFCVIKLLGSFAYNLANYYKWESAPELIERLNQVVHTLAPTLQYNGEKIRIIYNNLIQKRDPPSAFKTQFQDILDDAYKSTINQNNRDELVAYLNFKNKLFNGIDEVYEEYKVQWKQIDKQSNKACDSLMNNFANLEEDETFVMALDTVEEIKNEADDLIDPIIKRYENKISEMLNKINYEETGILEFNNLVSKYKDSLYEQFDQEVNSAYFKVITQRNFSPDMTQLLMTFFDVEKSVYKLTLSLGTSLNVFNYLTFKK